MPPGIITFIAQKDGYGVPAGNPYANSALIKRGGDIFIAGGNSAAASARLITFSCTSAGVFGAAQIAIDVEAAFATSTDFCKVVDGIYLGFGGIPDGVHGSNKMAAYTIPVDAAGNIGAVISTQDIDVGLGYFRFYTWRGMYKRATGVYVVCYNNDVGAGNPTATALTTFAVSDAGAITPGFIGRHAFNSAVTTTKQALADLGNGYCALTYMTWPGLQLNVKTALIDVAGTITDIADVTLDTTVCDSAANHPYVPFLVPLRGPYYYALVYSVNQTLIIKTLKIVNGIITVLSTTNVGALLGNWGSEYGLSGAFYIPDNILVLTWQSSDDAANIKIRTYNITPNGILGSMLDSQITATIRFYSTEIVQHSGSTFVFTGANHAAPEQLRADSFDIGLGPIVLPTVETDPATGVNYHVATLNGLLDSDGGDACNCWLNWGQTPTMGNIINFGIQYTGFSYASNLAGLASGTTYYFQAFASSSVGTVAGALLSFTTPSALNFKVVTLPATNIY